jgi:hypothetical protein
MNQPTCRFHRLIAPLLPPCVFLATFALYVATLAPSVVPGDPGEYQFIPHILGIAHPPGYAFFTILAKIWTSVVRIGSVAYRTNLLSAAAGAWTVVMVYQMVLLLGNWEIGKSGNQETGSQSTNLPAHQSTNSPIYHLSPLFAAAVLATSTDLWQHSIHANSHVISAALSATTLHSGLRWWVTGRDRWLYSSAFLAALGVTHHPLLAFGAPAYVAFVLAVRPGLLRDWRRLRMIALAILLGLSVFLYLPLRTGATSFGPSSDWDAIIGHATARGIRGNLFYFGLADQPVRLRVFWELLRLQFALPTLALAAVGLVWLARRRPRPFILLLLFYVINLSFIINTVQDVMAYLLLPFTSTAVLAGAGVLALLDGGLGMLRERRWQRARLWQEAALIGLTLLLAAGPVTTALHRAPRLSLRDFRLADEYIQAVFEQFAGKGEGAVLLAPWEGLTPLWYAQYVEGRRLDPADVQRLVFVAAGKENPWVEEVWAHIEEGPIYLVDYRPQVAAEGFRLRPVGDWPFYKVEVPPATHLPDITHPLDLWAGDAIHLLGWDLDRTSLRTGETAYLTLYMSTPKKLSDYYMPYLWLGDRLYRWTTDSRLNTPWWEPGEVVVERYAITVPFGTPPGDYPLSLGVTNVSQGQDLPLSDGETTVMLPSALRVEPAEIAPPEDVLVAALANVNSRIVLLGGRANARGRTVEAPWLEPLSVRPGDNIQVWLDWRALTAVDQPYTVFVHLIDGVSRPWAQHDYTPMGGAFPTFLWIPRWIEGQAVSDPYKLTVPLDAPPGDYAIEAGMYGMTSLRRAYHFDLGGNLAGDRYVLGPVRIETP